ncbi:unnamed protein product [Ectocarpus sp. 13 AM-2016]
MQDLEVALSKIDAVQACLGISQQHVADDGDLPEGSADVFPSVVRAAERALGDDDGYAPPKRWEHARLRGLTAGTAGVSGVLSFVDGRDVFWSKHCAGVASGNQDAAGRVVPRCSRCKEFWRDSLKGRIETFRGDAMKHTTTDNLSTDQKKTRIRESAADLKVMYEKQERLKKRVMKFREECTGLPPEQGDAVHKFLIAQETRKLLDSKLPPDSDERALLNV